MIVRESGPLTLLQPWHASMMRVSLQGRRSLACRPIQPGVKILCPLEGARAEHFAFSVAELWGLPVGEESVETVAGEI